MTNYIKWAEVVKWADAEARQKIHSCEKDFDFHIEMKEHGKRNVTSMCLYCGDEHVKVMQNVYLGYDARNDGGKVWFKYDMSTMINTKSEDRTTHREEVFDDYTLRRFMSDTRDRIRAYKYKHMLNQLYKNGR